MTRPVLPTSSAKLQGEWRWRDLTDAELREALRAVSWRTDKLDGQSFAVLVRDRSNLSVGTLLDDLFSAYQSEEEA